MREPVPTPNPKRLSSPSGIVNRPCSSTSIRAALTSPSLSESALILLKAS